MQQQTPYYVPGDDLAVAGPAAGLSDLGKGILLAVSSSVFIGSSFIIKKKGLRIAGTGGLRAGESRCTRPGPSPQAKLACPHA